jgi:hypothetical protein
VRSILVVRLELAQDEVAYRLLPLDEVGRKSEVHMPIVFGNRGLDSLQLRCRMVIYSRRRSTPIVAMRLAESE